MDENRFESLLAEYLEGAPDDGDLEELRDAIDSSPRLRSQFQQQTRLHVLLRESMSEQVEVNLIRESIASPVRQLPRAFTWLALANAGVLLVAASIYYFSNRPADSGPLLGICANVSGSGNVQIERNDTLLPLAPDDPLQVGDQITCDQHARALLRLRDGSILSLDKGAKLTLVSDRPVVRLERGEALFEIAKRQPGASSFQVHTGQSTVNVMGTVFGLADDGQTDLQVYEGLVSMVRLRDSKTVEVGTQQTASTRDEVFEARELRARFRKTISILPTDDITLRDGVATEWDTRLKVEANKRVAFLRFSVPAGTKFKSAKLLITQEIDTGSGKLQLHLGSHSDWSETSLTETNAPQRTRVLDEHRGVVTHGQVVEFDVPSDAIHPGPITLILTLDKSRENDIWFSSREGYAPPRLLLSAPLDASTDEA